MEFHYYSAEEGGLLGSQGVAKSYEDSGKKVLAMLQMDMTGECWQFQLWFFLCC